MSPEKREEFDIEMGGNVNLPKTVTIRELVNARINEIEALSEAIENPQRTGMIFQQLPKHMRRRVMSHNAKRMPNRLKKAHQALLDKCGATDVGKRPSRKYRRRPKNLRDEYVRRQRNNIWLETHIWHAKRFHMINTWGYRLAQYPNDKSYRACYRASSQHCMLQDVSFLCCIELMGEENEIISYLSRLSDDSFRKCSELRGEREATATLHHPDTRQSIGQVKFLWRGDKNSDSKRQLWLWSHPAFYSELYHVLLNNLESHPNLIVTSLKDQLVRFSLTGPKSLDVVWGALKVSDINQPATWASEYYSGRGTELQTQTNYFLNVIKLSDCGQMPSRCVLPALVQTRLPKLPQTMRIRETDMDMVIEKPLSIVSSPLWDQDMREVMKQSNEQAKKQFKNKLIPYDDEPVDLTPVAVIIIHRPGRQTNGHTGYGGGIDLICPPCWGQRVFLCLVHNGGRVCGLRDSQLVELQVTHNTGFLAQSNASVAHQQAIDLASRDKYFRLPPAKRPNYQIFGIINPYDLPWKRLEEEWKSDLIRVMIEIQSEGILTRSAPIYIPHPSDLNKPPVEPQHSDPNKSKRKLLNEKHKKDLKRIAKRRKKLRSNDEDIKNEDLPSSKNLVDEHKKKIEELWLGSVDNIRQHNSREIIGFITEGGYNYLAGKCTGYGFVVREGFSKLKDICGNKVLIRNINSLQYRLANVIPV